MRKHYKTNGFLTICPRLSPSCPPRLSFQLSSQRCEPMVDWPRRSVARALSSQLSSWIFGSGGRWPEELCPQLCPRVASLWFDGFSIQAVENIRDPPTQAVENITPLQKAPDMLRSWAAADTELTSPAKCVPAAESNFHALPKNGAVGGRFATV